MASDGDMFVQRKAWGYNKLCAAFCDNSPTEKLAEIETQSVGNMLSNGHAIPSLKASITQAFAILQSTTSELTLENSHQLQARLIESLHNIERENIAAASAVDVSKAVQKIALKLIESGEGCPSEQNFSKQCCEALGEFWMKRYGSDAFAPYVMSKTKIDSESYRQRSEDACQQAMPKVLELIERAKDSRGGRLSKRKVKRSKPINHTAEGLKEEML